MPNGAAQGSSLILSGIGVTNNHVVAGAALVESLCEWRIKTTKHYCAGYL